MLLNILSDLIRLTSATTLNTMAYTMYNIVGPTLSFDKCPSPLLERMGLDGAKRHGTYVYSDRHRANITELAKVLHESCPHHQELTVRNLPLIAPISTPDSACLSPLLLLLLLPLPLPPRLP